MHEFSLNFCNNKGYNRLAFDLTTTNLLFPLVLLAHFSLSYVPGYLVPHKQVLQSACCQVKLQTLLVRVLQGQHMGLSIFTIRH